MHKRRQVEADDLQGFQRGAAEVDAVSQRRPDVPPPETDLATHLIPEDGPGHAPEAFPERAECRAILFPDRRLGFL